MDKWEELEKRITNLENRGLPGRPPLRAEQAREYLVEVLSHGKPMIVSKIIEGSGFSQNLLSKARKELKYVVFSEGGNWYWQRNNGKVQSKQQHNNS